jgi:hypothetical protein
MCLYEPSVNIRNGPDRVNSAATLSTIVSNFPFRIKAGILMPVPFSSRQMLGYYFHHASRESFPIHPSSIKYSGLYTVDADSVTKWPTKRNIWTQACVPISLFQQVKFIRFPPSISTCRQNRNPLFCLQSNIHAWRRNHCPPPSPPSWERYGWEDAGVWGRKSLSLSLCFWGVCSTESRWVGIINNVDKLHLSLRRGVTLISRKRVSIWKHESETSPQKHSASTHCTWDR